MVNGERYQMKLLVYGSVTALFGLVLWFEYTQEVDKYHICRNLGHGGFYCFMAAAGSGR